MFINKKKSLLIQLKVAKKKLKINTVVEGNLLRERENKFKAAKKTNNPTQTIEFNWSPKRKANFKLKVKKNHVTNIRTNVKFNRIIKPRLEEIFKFHTNGQKRLNKVVILG